MGCGCLRCDDGEYERTGTIPLAIPQRGKSARWLLVNAYSDEDIAKAVEGRSHIGALLIDIGPDVLRTLRDDKPKVSDEGLATVTKLPDLECLCITGKGELTGSFLAYVAALCNLQIFYLSGFPAVTDESLAHLKELHALRVLSMRNCGVHGPGLATW